MNNNLYQYLLQLGDNALILGQRLCEWTGVAPELEIDLALSNIGLDLLGQANQWYEYAAELKGGDATPDTIAFLRDAHEYRNVQLVELPNGNFADTILRAVIFDTFNLLLHEALTQSSDQRIGAIAARAVKEISYHARYSKNWTLRLGGGTEESHQKAQKALNDIWDYAFEALTPGPVDHWAKEAGIGPDLEQVKSKWEATLQQVFRQASLQIPKPGFVDRKAKSEGIHTEHLGYILAEMQFLQRAYPNLQW